MYYLEVAPTITFRADASILTYSHSSPLEPGAVVTVPIGKRTVPAIVLRTVSQPDFPTKLITKVLYNTPIPQHLLKSATWLSEYYCCPLADCIRAILPSGVSVSRREVKSLVTPVARDFANCDDSRNETKMSPRDDGSDSRRARATGVTKISLNPSQQATLKSILAMTSTTRLLHGITGSGKTRIYLKLAEQQIRAGKSTILLLPEISLTTQLVTIFEQHFPGKILVQHSRLTDRERHLLWEQVLQSDQPHIIIGARSALFAPVSNLGCIIIDEAHEPAYCQDQNPKYSALRLAAQIARDTGSFVLQGTATPLVTEYALAERNHALVKLSTLAIKSKYKTTMTVSDLRNRQEFLKNRLFSDQLLASIQRSLDDRAQTLIFHNRRGTAPLTLCEQCGWQALCPTCLLPLVLHANEYHLICHACGFREKVPSSCPECKSASVIHKGVGTKLLETELRKLFPKANIIRFDADTSDDSTPDKLYYDICSGNFHIIIGTQMIAKGFDLPLLSTLAIPQADSLFSLPDYTSEERGYQLLTQAIGRATRGHRNTEIFVQTYQPNHPVVKLTTETDQVQSYTDFYSHTIRGRRQAHLPPYSYLAKLTLTYKTEAIAIKNIRSLSIQLQKSHPDVTISPPFPAFHELSTRGHTWQLNLTAKKRQALTDLISSLPPNPALRFTLDPPNLL